MLAAVACDELLPRYANYCWNRLMIVSAEDCAEFVTSEVVALYQAWAKVNDRDRLRSKGRIFFSRAIILLAKVKHNRDADELNHFVLNRFPEERFADELQRVGEVMEANDGDFDIPEWVYDKHTRQGKRAGATLEDFLRDEHHGLSNSTTMFRNFDTMLNTWGYVEPELDLTWDAGSES